MNCFYHRDISAVGSCKACSKGLCPSCAVDVGGGLACRDQCVEQVRRINQLMERSIRMGPVSEQVWRKQPRAYLMSGIFSMLAGGLFALLGQNMNGIFRIGVMGIGMLVMLMGAWQATLGWRLRSSSGNAKGSARASEQGDEANKRAG